MWSVLRTAARAIAPLGLASGGLLVCQCQGSSAFPTTFPYGLTGPGTTPKFYSPALDLKAPLLLRGSGDFMAAARADARTRLGLPMDGELSAQSERALEEEVVRHLHSVSERRSSFFRSRQVHDRSEVKAALQGLFVESGQFGLLLGGKSVGKSTLLSELSTAHRHSGH